MSRVTTPLKTHGGKHYLATRVRELMPRHTHYVEPYFGGGSVLLAGDGRGVSEVANDLNGNLTNFWRVLQKPDYFRDFHRTVEAIPFSQEEWREAGRHVQCPGMFPESNVPCLECAVRFFVLSRQSLSGRQDSFTGITRTRVRRGMNGEVSAWLSAVEGLPQVHARMKRVLILRKPALEVIDSEDTPNTLFYLDPPYLPETRATVGEYGDFEMTYDDHRTLLDKLLTVRGKVILSGYLSKLYYSLLRDWRCVTIDMPNNSAGGKTKQRRSEVIWMNY